MRKSNKDRFDTEEYRNAVSGLTKLGYKVEDIEKLAQIYRKANETKKTIVSAASFLSKANAVSEILLKHRNRGIQKGEAGRITRKDALSFLERNPGILCRNINHEISQRLNILDGACWGSQAKTNELLKRENSIFFATSTDKLYKINAVLSPLSIELEDGTVNLAEHCIFNDQQQLKNSAEKLYFRLSFMKEIGNIQNGTISKSDFTRAVRSTKAFESLYKEYRVTDEMLKQRYPLPNYDSENPGSFDEGIRRRFENIVAKEEAGQEPEQE